MATHQSHPLLNARVLCWVALAFGIAVLIPSAVHAADAMGVDLGHVHHTLVLTKGKKLIADSVDTAHTATVTATWTIMLNVLAGLAGIVTGLLTQVQNSVRARVAVVALGAFVAGVTLVNNTLWGVDANNVMLQADDVQKRAIELKGNIDAWDSFKWSDVAQQTQFEQESVTPPMNHLEETLESLTKAGIRPGSHLYTALSFSRQPAAVALFERVGLVKAVLAMQTIHQDNAYLYFDAAGEGASPLAASSAARENGLVMAANYLLTDWRNAKVAPEGATPETLKARLAEVATFERPAVTSSKGGFRATVTVKLSRLGVDPHSFASSSRASSDLFSGRWQLNVRKSTMGIYDEIASEMRDIHVGGTMASSWRRVLRGGHAQSGTFDVPCDGAEHLANGYQTSCRLVAPDEVDSYVKTPGHKPPVLYSVQKVNGDTLTINTYRDQEHTQAAAMLVYDRVPL